MYIKYITDEEIENFMKEFVRELHLRDNRCSQDSLNEVFYMRRKGDYVSLATILNIKNGNGTLKEDWILNSYEVVKCGEGYKEESKVLTREWSRFVYKTLKSRNEAMAEEYKNKFIERITAQRDSQIDNANKNYNELVF